MRTQILGLAAAAVAAGTLSLLAPTPAQAVGGIDGGNISGSGDVPTSVDVAAFGPGDAVAAWSRPVPGGTKVYAAIATDGVWAAPKAVTAAAVTDAHDVRAVANGSGDLAVVWNQTHGGEQKVRGARYLGGGTWDGSALLSPAVDIATVTGIDADIDAAGRVHVAYEAHHGDVDRVRTTVWSKGGLPQFTEFGTSTHVPSIDVNPQGDVILSYHVYSNGGTIMVTRRNATLGWLGPQAVAWPGSASEDSVARLADDGRGAVLIGGFDDGATPAGGGQGAGGGCPGAAPPGADSGARLAEAGRVAARMGVFAEGSTRAVVAKVAADGSLGAATPVSAAGHYAAERDLAVSPNGTLQASWSVFENGTTYRIREATALPNQGFGTSTVAESATTTIQHHVGLVSDRRFQVVVHNDKDLLTLKHRTNPAFQFGERTAGATDGAFAADMDRNGDVVAVGVVENGFSSYVEGEWLDLAGPKSSVTGPGAQVTSTAFDVTWSATDSLSGVKRSDVIASSAAWNSATFSDPKVVGDNLVSGPFHQNGGFGRTYCYEVQAVDKANNLGQRSARRCTAVPLDDTALLGTGWSRTTKPGQFNDTWTTTSTKGRILTRASIKAKRLALVANRLPNGGLVEVRWNGTLLRKISLKGAAASKKVYPIVTWGTVHTGTLKIKVLSASGRPVRLDGLVVAK